MKLHAFALSLTLGLVWGLTLFILTLVSIKTGYGEAIVKLFSTIYPGFDQSGQGAFVGLVWGFLDAFIGTYVVVWLYNFFVDKLAKK